MATLVQSKKWVPAAEASTATVKHLQETLKVREPLARLMVQRGLNSYQEAYNFFNPRYEETWDPFRMEGMQRAVERVQRAIKDQEAILVFGDYDVDGTTAVALVYRYLSHLTSNLFHYIPDRFQEGYGLSYSGIDYGLANGVSLMVVLDCGIKGHEHLEYAKNQGLDAIVGDHHQPGDHLPPAHTILNPKKADCPYPYKELSGCGIGFKLVQGLYRYFPASPDPQDSLDFVAVSTAADIVEMKGENRILAHHGLHKLNQEPNPAFEALKSVSGLEKALTIQDLVFKIGPRINAAGRVKHANNAVELLMAEQSSEAIERAKPVDNLNNERKQFDRHTQAEVLQRIETEQKLADRYTTVLFNPEWHKGVIGIVASSVMDHYFRPTILLTESNGLAVGSGRSVPGFNLYEALNQCSDLLNQFGGHEAAAGLSLPLDNLDAFAERFEAVVKQQIDPDLLIPTVDYDLHLSLSDIDWRFYYTIQRFGPFGPGNLPPVFMSDPVYLYQTPREVGQNHLKLQLLEEANGQVFDAIAFQQSHHAEHLQIDSPLAICYSIEANSFNGRTNLQLNVKDLKIHS